MRDGFWRRSIRVAAAATTLVGLLGGTLQAAAASRSAASTAGSIAFQHNAQIFVVRPDGSHLHQVTHSGSGVNPFTEPTQADNGTILAARGYSTLYRMDRNGRVLRAMKVASGVNVQGPLKSLAMGPAISRDGNSIAVSVVTVQGVVDVTTGALGSNILASDIQYWNAARGTKVGQTHLAGTYLMSPSWVDGRRLLIFAPYNVVAKQVYVFRYAGPGNNWFADEDTTGGSFVDRQPIDRGQLSRQGSRLALIHGPNLKTNWRQTSVAIYRVSSLGQAPAPLCQIPAQHGPFGKVTWSPDGTSLAWSDANGVWVSAVNTASSSCGVAPRLIAKGGANPFWGPAGVS